MADSPTGSNGFSRPMWRRRDGRRWRDRPDRHPGRQRRRPARPRARRKTFRLSAAQTRRGHLLSQLAANDWDLDAVATALGTDRHGLTLRLDRAGFGHLLRPDIIDACRNRARTLYRRPTRIRHAR